LARKVARTIHALPGYYWASDEIGRNEVERFSRELVVVEKSIAHLDDAQELAAGYPVDLATLANASGHLLTVMGTLFDVASVFEVGNVFEVDGRLTIKALVTRLHAALNAMDGARQDAKLLAAHLPYSICGMYRQNVFLAIQATGGAIGEQCVRAIDPYALREFQEGKPFNFSNQDPDKSFRRTVATILRCTAFSRTEVGSYMVAAIELEAERRRLVAQRTVKPAWPTQAPAAVDAPPSGTPPAKKAKPSVIGGDGQSNNQAAQRLLNLFTDGLADERFASAKDILEDDKLTADGKLKKIDSLLRIPNTSSSRQLGRFLGITKTAVQNTDWWIKNRKGEKANLIGRRHDVHGERAKQRKHERPIAGDE